MRRWYRRTTTISRDRSTASFDSGPTTLPGTHLRIGHFTVDQTAEDTGIRAFETYASDTLEVRNINVVGRHDSGTWGPGLFVVTDPDGDGLVRDFRAHGGGTLVENSPGDGYVGPNGILCNQGHEGTIRFVDCELGAFPDNGLYASGGTGRVIVEGGALLQQRNRVDPHRCQPG